jgi:hypothetical protein
MTARLVDVVFFWRYPKPSVYRPVYGRSPRSVRRPDGTVEQPYSKDYFQPTAAMSEVLKRFIGPAGTDVTWMWPGGSDTDGQLRRHATTGPRLDLDWSTTMGAPLPWKLTPRPSSATVETLEGMPGLDTIARADAEMAKVLATNEDPWLLAVHLAHEGPVLHSRLVLEQPNTGREFASWNDLPAGLRSAMTTLSGNEVMGAYIALPSDRMFFDPDRNRDPWLDGVAGLTGAGDDLVAESSGTDEDEVDALTAQVDAGSYAVADQEVTAKTRGSAQRVFADRVKSNYGWRCAMTGIATREFLVAAHIVPWSEDESIRLDPANGICLSTFVDRAFDGGYIRIHDDYTVHVDWGRVGADGALREALAPIDGRSLTLPDKSQPNPDFLRRRLGIS